MTAVLERTRAAKQSRTRQESTRACQCLGNHKKRTVNKENKGNKENKENKEKKEVQDDWTVLEHHVQHLSAVQWARPGLELNLASTPTACAMSGLVATARYMRAPTSAA